MTAIERELVWFERKIKSRFGLPYQKSSGSTVVQKLIKKKVPLEHFHNETVLKNDPFLIPPSNGVSKK